MEDKKYRKALNSYERKKEIFKNISKKLALEMVFKEFKITIKDKDL